MKIKHILIIPFICIAFTGCEDNNPITPTQNTPNQEQLPPITTTGAGTFGCKINGKVWVANSNTSWPHIYFAFNKANNSIILSGNLIQKPVDDLKVNLRFPYITDSTIYCIGFNPNPVPSGGGVY